MGLPEMVTEVRRGAQDLVIILQGDNRYSELTVALRSELSRLNRLILNDATLERSHPVLFPLLLSSLRILVSSIHLSNNLAASSNYSHGNYIRLNAVINEMINIADEVNKSLLNIGGDRFLTHLQVQTCSQHASTAAGVSPHETFTQSAGIRDISTTAQYAENAPPCSENARKYVFRNTIDARLLREVNGNYDVRIILPENVMSCTAHRTTTKFFKICKDPIPSDRRVLYNISDGSSILYELWSRFDGKAYNNCWIRERGNTDGNIVRIQLKSTSHRHTSFLASLTNFNYMWSNANSIATNPEYMKVNKTLEGGSTNIAASELAPHRTAAIVTGYDTEPSAYMEIQQGVNVPLFCMIMVAADIMDPSYRRFQ